MKTSRTSRERIFWRTTLKNGAWRVSLLKAWYLVVVSNFFTAPMPWLFSRNNTFAHEEPATINALMSASVEGKSPTTAPQTVFAHRHAEQLLAVSLRNCPPTLRNFWWLMSQSQVVIFVRRIAGPQYLYIIQMSGPQLNSEASTYSRPLLGSWTFLSRRIAPTTLSSSFLPRNSPIRLPRAGGYRFAESDSDRHQQDDVGAIQTQHIAAWIPTNDLDESHFLLLSSLPNSRHHQ
jgi:hypothetical protein